MEPSPTITSAIEAEREKVLTQYDLDVQFDYTNHSLQVQQEINYSNNSSDPITELEFVVEGERTGDGFSLFALQTISGPQAGEPNISGGILHLPLQSSLNSGESIELFLEYRLVVPAGAGTLSWTDRQTNFIDWYPYIPPYISGQGWLIHEPASVGEYSVFESANFSVHIEVKNAPSSLQIAAPALDETTGTTFDYELLNARRFVWSASGQYEVKDTEFDEIPIRIYFFNEHRDAAKTSLDTAKEALEIYSDLFGEYPYKSLAIVDAQFFDGMESDGLFFLDQSYFLQYNYSFRNYLTALTAHEVAHNWWFGQVGNDQALEPWLDEAFCIYSEMLYYENTHPEMVSWWWEFRIDRFRPSGWVGSTIYDHSGFESYVDAVYMRGAQFLQEVRNTIGDREFFAFLHEYATQGAGKISSAESFFELLNKHSPLSLDSIISNYFEKQ